MGKKISKKKLENLSDEEITKIFQKGVDNAREHLRKKGILKEKENDKKE